MSEDSVTRSLTSLGNSLERLREALAEPQTNPLAVDGTIQRFEFVIELYWKAFKRLLAVEKIQAHTPRECVKKAYQAKWISDEAIWLNMLEDRNRSSHVYNEAGAMEIYTNIRRYQPVLDDTYRLLCDLHGQTRNG